MATVKVCGLLFSGCPFTEDVDVNVLMKNSFQNICTDLWRLESSGNRSNVFLFSFTAKLPHDKEKNSNRIRNSKKETEFETSKYRFRF